MHARTHVRLCHNMYSSNYIQGRVGSGQARHAHEQQSKTKRMLHHQLRESNQFKFRVLHYYYLLFTYICWRAGKKQRVATTPRQYTHAGSDHHTMCSCRLRPLHPVTPGSKAAAVIAGLLTLRVGSQGTRYGPQLQVRGAHVQRHWRPDDRDGRCGRDLHRAGTGQ